MHYEFMTLAGNLGVRVVDNAIITNTVPPFRAVVPLGPN